jgi:hypothetical protein
MPTKSQLDAASLYAAIMDEIKVRISAIDAGTGGLMSPHIHPFLIREHCYLQLRMICELVAISCLVAHGDMVGPKIRQLRKEWSAEKIMEELGKLHPDFYPTAVRQDTAGTEHKLTVVSPSPFPKEELLKLYGRSGDVLHRGNATNLVKRGHVQINFPDITELAQKIHDLLAIHILNMKGGKDVSIAMLRNRDDDMKVQVNIAERQTVQSTAPSLPEKS